MLPMVSARTGNVPVYFDCLTKSQEDLYLPMMLKTADGRPYMGMVPNEEFGLQFDRPVDVMFDELGKNRALVNSIMRTMLSHEIGMYKLPKGSRCFATTNIGAENVGDVLQAQHYNRITRLRSKKISGEQWTVWGMDHDILPELMTAAHEMPDMFVSFLDVADPKDNNYIHDPRVPERTAFATPRSLAKLNHILRARLTLGMDVTTQLAVGTVGAAAAKDIMAYVMLGDTLAKRDEILADPRKAKIPTNGAAHIMAAYSCAQWCERETFDNVFTYVQRLKAEAAMMFTRRVMGMRSKSGWVHRMSKFTEYAEKNYGLLAP